MNRAAPIGVLLLVAIFGACGEGPTTAAKPAPVVTVVETVAADREPTPEPVDVEPPAPPLFKFHRAEVLAFISDDFQKVFGEGPTAAELTDYHEWLNWVVVKLQRQNGYSPERAASIAELRFEEDFYSDEQVAWILENRREQRQMRKIRENMPSVDDLVGGSDAEEEDCTLC